MIYAMLHRVLTPALLLKHSLVLYASPLLLLPAPAILHLPPLSFVQIAAAAASVTIHALHGREGQLTRIDAAAASIEAILARRSLAHLLPRPLLPYPLPSRVLPIPRTSEFFPPCSLARRLIVGSWNGTRGFEQWAQRQVKSLKKVSLQSY